MREMYEEWIERCYNRDVIMCIRRMDRRDVIMCMDIMVYWRDIYNILYSRMMYNILYSRIVISYLKKCIKECICIYVEVECIYEEYVWNVYRVDEDSPLHRLQRYRLLRPPTKRPIKHNRKKIIESLYKCKAITKQNFESKQNVHIQSSSRTDKNVHAVYNVVVCKIEREINKEFQDELKDELFKFNIYLYKIMRVTKSFVPSKMCIKRVYEYFVPSWYLQRSDFCKEVSDMRVDYDDMRVDCGERFVGCGERIGSSDNVVDNVDNVDDGDDNVDENIIEDSINNKNTINNENSKNEIDNDNKNTINEIEINNNNIINNINNNITNNINNNIINNNINTSTNNINNNILSK
ncbi:trna pseudouridine synthase a [Vairimorpha apis BRL 01]|uniref:Trna pseudouridine synthase a n=1 Tax=Vairimorpha apis BRL 01 TaxID=1037528 RepID=T0L580_9MICR|nr:trna pseudouridine synthase a [Vairimorpha apis BRL 01]